MKKVITAEDIRDLLKSNGDVKSLPADAIYTPSARDLLREMRITPGGNPSAEAAPKADGSVSVEQFYRSRKSKRSRNASARSDGAFGSGLMLMGTAATSRSESATIWCCAPLLWLARAS